MILQIVIWVRIDTATNGLQMRHPTNPSGPPHLREVDRLKLYFYRQKVVAVLWPNR